MRLIALTDYRRYNGTTQATAYDADSGYEQMYWLQVVDPLMPHWHYEVHVLPPDGSEPLIVSEDDIDWSEMT